MTIEAWLVIISSIISLTGIATYIRDTIASRSKPNLVTWSLWAMAPFIGTAAALAAHQANLSTVRVFLAGFAPFLVVVTSLFNPKSYWKLTRFDFTCGAISVLAIIAWLGLGSTQWAVALAVAADGLALLPTLRKAWNFPETETGLTFLAGLISTIIVMPLIPRWDIENSAFQIYLLVANSLLVLFIYRKKLKFKK
ncbi:MAG: hypothetical protein JW816_03870 [Candidatus Buchananbacteria bacterium]|nr:hypothetical protein [Candidatus Buchananbacteria bacterium]